MLTNIRDQKNGYLSRLLIFNYEKAMIHKHSISSKEDIIQTINQSIIDKTHIISCLANVASIIYHSLENINWAGFYFRNNYELLLGPFCGKPACERILIDNGVCGYSAKIKKTVIIPNVDNFENHIACDPNSKSEIVIPLLKNSILYGVLDIDSPKIDRFNADDKLFFEKITELIMKHPDIDLLKNIYKI